MSAQPAHLQALQRLTNAQHMLESPPRTPPLEWWRQLAQEVRAAREHVLERPADPLIRRAEFLLLGILECTTVKTYYEGDEILPHVEVVPGQEKLFNIIIQEVHNIGHVAMLARVGR